MDDGDDSVAVMVSGRLSCPIDLTMLYNWLVICEKRCKTVEI